ncbi:MAG: hypothetical protein KatS3mg081_2537 [Gemmatimonadales bacterium]|nr:MAG: hypothetical protein KatS3mg081_2537 [Gemmatimonadales bacterium]
MRVCIVTPAPRRSHYGNRVTALRWARLLRELGHRVEIAQRFETQRCDLLIALHARRSADSIERFRQKFPGRPIVLVLTGTDLYRDLPKSAVAQRALAAADRLVVLQPMALEALPRWARGRARVVFQSAVKPPKTPAPNLRWFDVCVLAHLRPVKDPLRTALAARLLPPSSRIRVIHLGAGMDPGLERRAKREMRRNRRYRWLGDRPRWKALRILACSRLLALTSVMEGGANVISEAIVCGVPVIASRIPGTEGILGSDYPGYFEAKNTRALAELLHRAEKDQAFYGRLRERCLSLAPLFDPARERSSLGELLADLFSESHTGGTTQLSSRRVS